jgi:hypothetical protein
LVDTLAPTVSTVSEATAAAVTKDPITFTVTFSEALTGTVSTSSFTATNGTVTSVTQVDSSNVYTVLVTPTAGVASGTVELSLVGTGLSDAAGNAVLSADFSRVASQDIDTLAPTVSTITEATADAVTKDPITFTVSFSEALTGTVSTSSFTATNGTVTSVTQVRTTNVYTVVVTPTAGVASGTVALSLVGTGLSDAAGNAVVSTDLSSLASQAVDTLKPIATLLDTDISPNTQSVEVKSSELGTAYLVKTGGTSPVIVTSLDSITGANRAKWNELVITQADFNSNLSLAGLEDGTYSLYSVDAAGNLSDPAANSHTVDTTAPTLSNTAAPSVALSTITGTAGNSLGETITLTLTFDGPVNGLTEGTDSSIFTVDGTGVAATWSGTGSTRNLTYTISAGQNGLAAISETALKAALIAGITDAAGNVFTSGNISNIDPNNNKLPVVDTITAQAQGSIAPTVASGAAIPGIAFTEADAVSDVITHYYFDFSAIWDAYNGTRADAAVYSVPPGWSSQEGTWSATPSESWHLAAALHSGEVWRGGVDNFTNYHVALQVL